MEDFLIADKEMRESFEEDGKEYPNLDFRFVLDVGSFLITIHSVSPLLQNISV